MKKTCKIKFKYCKPIFRRITEESAECDDGRKTGKVDKEVGGDALHREPVSEVGQVERGLALDVIDQT